MTKAEKQRKWKYLESMNTKHLQLRGTEIEVTNQLHLIILIEVDLKLFSQQITNSNFYFAS